MVDTRNAFEVGVGTFAGAIDPGIGSFTELPDALVRTARRSRGQRVVTFCTGGIRCEKAVLWLKGEASTTSSSSTAASSATSKRSAVATGTASCFVFDRRVSLRPDLSEGSWQQDYPSREVFPPAP